MQSVQSLSPRRESHLRSLLKAFSWRTVGTLTTAAVAYVVVGELGTAMLIGGAEFFIKLGVYYAHERVWQSIPDLPRTRSPQPDSLQPRAALSERP